MDSYFNQYNMPFIIDKFIFDIIKALIPTRVYHLNLRVSLQFKF